MQTKPEATIDDGETRYNARASTPSYTAIFERWERVSAQVRERFTSVGACQLDIAYGEHPTEKLDLFLPKGPAHATLIYIHGGYWSSLDKSYASLVAPTFTDQGYAVATINHALCPDASVPAIVDQVHAAAAWLRAHCADWQEPQGRLFSCGHSSGAHLAAMLLTPSRPDMPDHDVCGAICISGLYDLRPLLGVPSITSKTNLNSADATVASPALRVPRADTVLLTALGSDENQGFHDQANTISHTWSAAYAEQIYCANRDHFTILDELIQPNGKIAKTALQLMSSHTAIDHDF